LRRARPLDPQRGKPAANLYLKKADHQWARQAVGKGAGQGNRVLNATVLPVISERFLSCEEAPGSLTSSFRRRPESRQNFNQQATVASQPTFLGSGFRRKDGQELSPWCAVAEDMKLDASALGRPCRADGVPEAVVIWGHPIRALLKAWTQPK
jgi:hypothetical protein